MKVQANLQDTTSFQHTAKSFEKRQVTKFQHVIDIYAVLCCDLHNIIQYDLDN